MRRHRLGPSAVRPTKTGGKPSSCWTLIPTSQSASQPVPRARTASNAAEELLPVSRRHPEHTTWTDALLADAEHFTVELLDKVKTQTNFDLLVPMPDQPSRRKKLQEFPPETFQPRWAGYATAKLTYTPRNSQAGPFYQYIQREGERPEEHHFKAFLSTMDRDEVETLPEDFSQAVACRGVLQCPSGVEMGQGGDLQSEHTVWADDDGMLIAQTAIDRLRKRLGPPAATWDAEHLAKSYFEGLEGDVRVTDNKITVTYYNAT